MQPRVSVHAGPPPRVGLGQQQVPPPHWVRATSESVSQLPWRQANSQSRPLLPPSQHSVLQIVPSGCWRQAPAPLHEPSLPQLETSSSAHSLSGSWPAVTGAQVPFATPVFDVEQARHDPPHADSQQTRSTQLPEAQSPPSASGSQTEPSGRRLLHTPESVSHELPSTQSSSSTQFALQTSALAQRRLPAHTPCG